MNKSIFYTSTRSNLDPVNFEQAVLDGFAPDGGFYVPTSLPHFSTHQLNDLKDLPYTQLVSHICGLFIDEDSIPKHDLDDLIADSFKDFEHPDTVPLVPCPGHPNTFILELFHGPTQSFKDVAMGLLIKIMDYLLKKRGERRNLVLATTGDTGPAAVYGSANLSSLTCFPLFPNGTISKEQEGQMTGVKASNIYPVGASHCKNGVDDLDQVIEQLFADKQRVKDLKLSSVNSINWCRVMVQSVHYFYAYFQACALSKQAIGDGLTFSVPAGAFGNLFAGYLAREMGLPIDFICATNANPTLVQTFSNGVFSPSQVISTHSSAIDISLPNNFWRFLYFNTGRDHQKIDAWMKQIESGEKVELDEATFKQINTGFKAISISDKDTLATIHTLYNADTAYLIDPHGAVALKGALAFDKHQTQDSTASQPVVCCATAHPAKFPNVISSALGLSMPDNTVTEHSKSSDLPQSARHPNVKVIPQDQANMTLVHINELKQHLINSISSIALRQ